MIEIFWMFVAYFLKGGEIAPLMTMRNLLKCWCIVVDQVN